MSKTHLSLLGLITAVSITGIGYLLVKNNLLTDTLDQKEGSCESIDIEGRGREIEEINNSLSNSSSTTKDVSGLSTEGGEQTTYFQNGNTLLIRQTFYGETGKSNVSYFFIDEKVFYVLKENTQYLHPLSQDPSGIAESIELKEFYLDSNQKLCFWYLNNQRQSTDADSVDLIEFLLSQL